MPAIQNNQRGRSAQLAKPAKNQAAPNNVSTIAPIALPLAQAAVPWSEFDIAARVYPKKNPQNIDAMGFVFMPSVITSKADGWHTQTWVPHSRDQREWGFLFSLF